MPESYDRDVILMDVSIIFFFFFGYSLLPGVSSDYFNLRDQKKNLRGLLRLYVDSKSYRQNSPKGNRE